MNRHKESAVQAMAPSGGRPVNFFSTFAYISSGVRFELDPVSRGEVRGCSYTAKGTGEGEGEG